MQEEDFPKIPAALENQAKEVMHELRDLGAELVELSVGQLKRINLPENIFDAVRECQKITAHGARRRQIQYLGKLMRSMTNRSAPAWPCCAANRRPKPPACTAWSASASRLLEDEAVLADIAANGPASTCSICASCAAMRSRKRKQQTAEEFPRHLPDPAGTRPKGVPGCRRMKQLIVGLVSISDRASTGVYEDKGIPPCRSGWRRPDHAVARQKPGSLPTISRPSSRP